MPAFRTPSVAATLSFVFPGLGQLSSGAWRRAILVGLPVVAVVTAGVVAIATGALDLYNLAFDVPTFNALLAANLVLAAYRVLAVADAYRVGVRRRTGGRASRAGLTWVALLIIATLALHGGLEALGLDANGTLNTIFPGSDAPGAAMIPAASFGPDPTAKPTPMPRRTPAPSHTVPATPSSATGGTSPSPAPSSASPGTSGSVSTSPSPSPSPRPAAVPAWAKDGRLNLLLIGGDAGPDRWSLRTDTIIVLSVDAKTGRTALFGIPRNMTGVPLAPEDAGAFANGRFPGLINALYTYAAARPAHFPGVTPEQRGFRAVAGAVQELVGVPLDGIVVVNLAGFVQLVDQLGGLWIDIPSRLVDKNYPLEDGSGWISLNFSPGCQHLDGRMALAYARSRHQDSDYGRMARQQLVLKALRRQLDPLRLVSKAPTLLKIAQDNLWTTISRKDVAGLAQLASRVDARRIKTILFAPSRYPAHVDNHELGQIRYAVRHALDAPIPVQPDQPAGASCT